MILREEMGNGDTMKLILITKEDWKEGNLVVKSLNLIINAVSLIGIVVVILGLMDWAGFL
tara:strand:+ start:321 stop:500 length:180 start_codon:yes stop_codon:yes gene_type:complete